jgi:hypothetical protein
MYNDVVERLTKIAANDELTVEQFNAVQDCILALQEAQKKVKYCDCPDNKAWSTEVKGICVHCERPRLEFFTKL